MGKKTRLLAVAGAVVFALSGCGSVTADSSETEQKAQIIRVAFNQSEEHPEYLAMKEF